MKKINTAQISIGIVCMITTYIITCQFGSVKVNNASNPEKMRLEELQSRLTLEREKNEDMLARLVEAQKSLESYRNEINSGGKVMKSIVEEFNQARVLAGITEVKGEGLVVTLDDGKELNSSGEKFAIVHDSDIRMVLCELSAAGAEAISINGQRIVATSAVRCVGNTVMINDVKIAPPFEISAIGNGETLEAAINIKGGVADYLKGWGIVITTKKTGNISIPRYSGVVNMKYAQPVIEEASE
ncbi:MAG: DUF881 domain-containing protein [Oscillospiraceae bacterium]|nr:DUF881 domain-containing protein [Oscillospiraceae bacterium]